MAELRSRGVAFALDDFGIGSSSFENIIEAEIKYLKIDKSFVHSIGRDPRRVLMLDGLIELARKLDVDIVAEGVEKQEEWSYLLGRGVRYGQGWLFSPRVGPGPCDIPVGRSDVSAGGPAARWPQCPYRRALERPTPGCGTAQRGESRSVLSSI
jgi:EAL domain-containing protein (putative c-di-GMP-specific phosphodiesterase class I)